MSSGSDESDEALNHHDLATDLPIEDEHEEHIDERWLVSYADMMTLLFGLFVMLYSMASKFDAVQASASKEFTGKSTAVAPPKVEIPDLREDVERLKTELIKAQAEKSQVAAHLAESETLQAQIRTENQNWQKKTLELEARLDSFSKASREQLPSPPVATVDVEAQKRTIQSLQRQLRENKVASADQKTVQDQLEQEQKRVEELNGQIEAMKKELKNLQDQPKPVPFATVVMTWDTQDHDLDLIITDPKGQVFDFKHRQFAGHPGKFVLDTRRGPGAEMWQTNQIIPGRYKIRYVFYNPYGNEKKAVVKGVIYTAAGNFDLPVVELDFKSKRETTLNVDMSSNGQIHIP